MAVRTVLLENHGSGVWGEDEGSSLGQGRYPEDN